MFTLKGVKFKDIIDVDRLDIAAGKVTCIVGESGSGKTTLLKLLNKMISCDVGQILYHEKDIAGIDPVEIRRQVVMLPQSPAIFEGSVEDNLLIGLKFSGKKLASKVELKQVLKLVNLNKKLDDEAESLSGGEKQRVALARVILMEPEVLLLDEPSSALDEDTEQLIINELVRYTLKNEKSLVMVTHSKKMATDFADEIIKIKDGAVIDKEVR
ncbi:ATP-binding cassette domain-containing protein [Proteinivorax hydrogeniformans]|uniref:ABC transporter ATP-binding protein n=1 Tax=Proteinivorax hydrogeniformans TaxID=1826727 RepID=UPI00338DE11C